MKTELGFNFRGGLFIKEIQKTELSAAEYIDAYEQIKQSKQYRELAAEQYEDGSWGPFHGGLIELVKKQKFKCTEAALIRAKQLSIEKDDTMIAKTIKLMEKYLRGEEAWIDRIEKHKDNGKGHLFCRPFMTAAFLNMFDSENPVIEPFRNVLTETLMESFASGSFNIEYWNQKVMEYRVPSIAAPWVSYDT